MKLAGRFSGANGARLLREALLKQPIFESNTGVVDQIAAVASIEPYEADKIIIKQDAVDSDILFILAGSVIISPNGRDDTVRNVGTHVGELTTIDPSVHRSATVRAKVQTVIARVREPDFSRIANDHPFVWRHLARELGQRLRERVLKVQTRNVTARVFIGSSSEGLKQAKALAEQFSKDPYEVKVWTDGIFTPGHTNIEALETEIQRSDFAVLLLSPDDQVLSRWIWSNAPRDNLIFELGLFMGAIGRKRALIVSPQGKRLKLPSDLEGITSIRYEIANMEFAAKELRKLIADLGTK